MTQPLIDVDSILRAGARKHPERVAVAWQEQRLSYAELERRTRALAAGLYGLGLRPGDRVSLLGRNSVDYAVGVLAVLRSGLVFAPLNWRHNPQELEATVADYEPSALLYAEEFAAQAAALQPAFAPGRLFRLDEPGGPALPEGDDSALVPLDADRLAAIISTGGTEGPAKGVMVSHGNMAASVVNVLSVESPRAKDVYLVLPQMFHNPQLYLLPYLFVGARLIVPPMPSFDAELVLETIERERVTRFLGVATMMNYLLAATSLPERDLSSLELVPYGGGPFSATTLRRAVEAFGCGFLQLYGQTEMSVLVSTLSPEDHRRALDDEGCAHLLTSCGQQVPLAEARVVDEDGKDVPADGETVGEIIARGPSMMMGYWRRPELTAATLRDGWCHSGDLAVRDADGYLYIVDRRKEMIVTGGENVFPRVVEEVVYQHPAVQEAAVVGVPDETWGEAVKAVVVLREGARATEQEIIAHCRERLAGYMKPRSVDFVDALPKNPSGKVLKSELRERYWSGQTRRVGGV